MHQARHEQSSCMPPQRPGERLLDQLTPYYHVAYGLPNQALHVIAMLRQQMGMGLAFLSLLSISLFCVALHGQHFTFILFDAVRVTRCAAWCPL